MRKIKLLLGSVPLLLVVLTTPLLVLWSRIFVALYPYIDSASRRLAIETLIGANSPSSLAALGYLSTEIPHLGDVYKLITLSRYAWIICIIIVFIYRKQILSKSTIAFTLKFLLGSILVLTACFMLFWDQAFIVFHRVLFPQGNWAFPADSLLIRTFPEAFWMTAFFAYLVLLSLLLLSIHLGGVLLKTPRDVPDIAAPTTKNVG